MMDLRQKLIEAGYQQAQQFTWEHTAGVTMSIFEKVGNTL